MTIVILAIFWILLGFVSYSVVRKYSLFYKEKKHEIPEGDFLTPCLLTGPLALILVYLEYKLNTSNEKGKGD